jgi:hypothetical protein
MADNDSFVDKVTKQLQNSTLSVQNAIKWFRDNAKLLSTVNGNILMSRDRARLVNSSSLKGPRYIGRMIMFFYQPKYRETLPYYDMFPLVIVVQNYPDGFLGLNLHYLPIMYRAKLLDALYTIYTNKQLDENVRLKLSYKILNNTSRLSYFKPCLKRYLFKGNDYRGGGVTSSFFVVDPKEWDRIIMLPVERFMNKTASQVQAISISKVK